MDTASYRRNVNNSEWFSGPEIRLWIHNLCDEVDRLRAALAQPVPDAVPLKWAEAPRRTEWGAGMMEALIALGADETLQLYAHRDAVPLVDALLSAQPAPALVPLTDEQIDAIRGRAECWEHVGQRIEFRYRPFTRAIEAAHGIGTPAKEAP